MGRKHRIVPVTQYFTREQKKIEDLEEGDHILFDSYDGEEGTIGVFERLDFQSPPIHPEFGAKYTIWYEVFRRGKTKSKKSNGEEMFTVLRPVLFEIGDLSGSDTDSDTGWYSH